MALSSMALRRPWAGTATRRAGAAITLALLGVACGGSSTSPTGPTTTVTFSGTLAANATAVYAFTVVQDGTVSLTLTSLSPQTTITMGMGIGYPDPTGACSLATAYEAASIGYTLSGPINAGAYCLAFYDVGNVLTSVNYVLTLTHT